MRSNSAFNEQLSSANSYFAERIVMRYVASTYSATAVIDLVMFSPLSSNSFFVLSLPYRALLERVFIEGCIYRHRVAVNSAAVFPGTPCLGGGVVAHTMPSPSSTTTTARRLDIVPGRGLLAYTLYALICTISGPLLLVSVELLNKIFILLQPKSQKTLRYQRLHNMQLNTGSLCAA